MSDRVAFLIALTIVLAAAADFFLNDGQILFQTALRLIDLLEWLAFWR